MTAASIGFGLLLLSMILQAVGVFRRWTRFSAAWVLNGSAALLFLVDIIIRSFRVEYVALLGTYDSLIFYSAVLLGLLTFYDKQKKYPPSAVLRFGVTAVAVALAALASSPLVDSVARPPIPALRSGWLVAHVALAFIGEAFFAFSFVTAIISLAVKNTDERKHFSRLTHSGIFLGYPIFTIGALIFGAVWAEFAWGRWWSWDPKETWALITWLVYSIYLHLSLIRKASDRTLALFSILGFLSTLFTFFGVNYLLGGLHSYG
ncbi:MAG: cytochrome c biogenesis protein CcsA [Spirochaetaceae bacterium]|nr:cytochrome c biogenesis protein CcsA [Spirochaetaceae bacterium]MDT8298026.1 cytochrome c biogenesis protein CcsA [Spirochaetaceae bacterium]